MRLLGEGLDGKATFGLQGNSTFTFPGTTLVSPIPVEALDFGNGSGKERRSMIMLPCLSV